MATIDIILGPMFSGKSEELCRRIRRYEAINIKCLKINHTLDTRTDEFIQTHSNIKIPAVKSNILMPLKDSEFFKKSKVIAIDEAQFFNDLYDFIKYCESMKKTVIIAGLDGDSDRNPFGQILQCIPLCDSVVKLKSYDMINKDGTAAIFTMRINKNEINQVSVGGSDKYISVSRTNYLERDQ